MLTFCKRCCHSLGIEALTHALIQHRGSGGAQQSGPFLFYPPLSKDTHATYARHLRGLPAMRIGDTARCGCKAGRGSSKSVAGTQGNDMDAFFTLALGGRGGFAVISHEI